MYLLHSTSGKECSRFFEFIYPPHTQTCVYKLKPHSPAKARKKKKKKKYRPAVWCLVMPPSPRLARRGPPWRSQTDARSTPPYRQSCRGATQGDSKAEQKALFSFLTHTYTPCGLFYQARTHTHNTMQAGSN